MDHIQAPISTKRKISIKRRTATLSPSIQPTPPQPPPTLPTPPTPPQLMIPPFKMTAPAKLALLQSHFLSIPRLINQTLQYYTAENIQLPFDLDPTDPTNKLLIFSENDQKYVKTETTDLVIEELAIKAWKYVIDIYEQLKEKPDLYDEFMDRHTPYTQYRISEFVEDYTDFLKNGNNNTWKDFKAQIKEIVFEHLKTTGSA